MLVEAVNSPLISVALPATTAEAIAALTAIVAVYDASAPKLTPEEITHRGDIAADARALRDTRATLPAHTVWTLKNGKPVALQNDIATRIAQCEETARREGWRL